MWLRRKTKTQDCKITHDRVKATQQMDTLVGVKSRVKGDISFSGGLHIDGELQGNIYGNPDEQSLLIVGKNANIKGDIKVHRAVVNGKVTGKLYVYEHLELGEKAVIQGDVYYNLLEIAIGAEVRGIMFPEIKLEANSLLEDHNKRNKIEAEVEPVA